LVLLDDISEGQHEHAQGSRHARSVHQQGAHSHNLHASLGSVRLPAHDGWLSIHGRHAIPDGAVQRG
jgi:hypothetical protein